MTINTGRFVWFEHVSADPTRAQGFLGELFNWTTRAMPTPGGSYTLITLGDEMIGGYPTTKAAPGKGHWVSHLQVTDTRASAKQVASLGGKVLVEPVDMGMGIYALVADPQGGQFALWQPAKADGTGDYKQANGAFCWNELVSDDPDASIKFYSAIGGFTVKTQQMAMGTYHMLESDGKPRAGIMKKPMPEAPHGWIPYVTVASADGTGDKAKKLGGAVILPPVDVPGVGRLAILADPSGATLGILQPAA